jgi:hypothetical protein
VFPSADIFFTTLARMALLSTIVDSTDELAYHERFRLQQNPPTAEPACNERNSITMRLSLTVALDVIRIGQLYDAFLVLWARCCWVLAYGERSCERRSRRPREVRLTKD